MNDDEINLIMLNDILYVEICNLLDLLIIRKNIILGQ